MQKVFSIICYLWYLEKCTDIWIAAFVQGHRLSFCLDSCVWGTLCLEHSEKEVLHCCRYLGFIWSSFLVSKMNFKIRSDCSAELWVPSGRYCLGSLSSCWWPQHGILPLYIRNCAYCYLWPLPLVLSLCLWANSNSLFYMFLFVVEHISYLFNNLL